MPPVVLLSLLRGSEGLSVWVARAPAGGAALFGRMPLAALPPALYRPRDSLLADWQSLCAARELDAVWPAFWRVFWNTLTDTEMQPCLPIPQRVTPPARPTATAAHPRAFRGTKFQPPKPPAPALELGAWLGDDRLLDGFFARHDFARWPVLDEHGQPCPDWFDAGQAPTVSGLLARRAGERPVLPQAFRRTFLWQLRLRPAEEVTAWLQAWRGLGSMQQGPELALLARLCALDPAAHGWAGLALHLPPARRSVFLAAVLAQRAYLLPCDDISASQLAVLDADTGDDQRFDVYLNAVLANLSRQVSAAYTLCGCALANGETNQDEIERLASTLHASSEGAPVPMADIDRMLAALGDDYQHWRFTAWKNCGTLPGFDAVLRDTCWEQLAPAVADQWLAIFQGIFWEEQEDDRIEQRWHAYRAFFPEWQRGLAALSGAWQEKYVRMLRGYVSGWENIDTLRASVPYFLALQQQFCRLPFSATADGDCVLSVMAEPLQRDGWLQLAATGEPTWLMIERACRRDNDAVLISRGLHSLAQCWPAFLLHALGTAPKRLLRTARLLGCLAHDRRRQFLSETAHTTWFSTRWTELDPLEACSRLVRLCAESGLNSPLPRRLRDHIEGRITLNEVQIERHCRVCLMRLPTVLLAALDMAVWRSIDSPFLLRERSTAASHAVRLLAGMKNNRKGLRRFLLAYCQGSPHAYLDHPLNRAWYARHPRIDAATWRTTPSCAMEGSNGIRLALETEPLEILMLGTYVGSCLGLGGLCDDSPVACLLDANKQVVYARDASGRVLARQLLAIDEHDRLVCFSVYPITASEALASAFDAFSRALACALGIGIYRHQDEPPYDIAIVLAQYWWDDGLWDPATALAASAT